MDAPIRVLTGITTSGIPHLGNYAGAIRPAISASLSGENIQPFLFLADYHSLINTRDPERVGASSFAIAATWLACGLDPEKAVFYRQSNIPEVFELTWVLGCVAAKGLLNRAHAYKAKVDENLSSENTDSDKGINLALFAYPVLMASDILLFNAHRVPVGPDQVQHLEITRDIAQRFNHLYGECFVIPEVVVDNRVATLPGLDGRKMSKSYDNVIPLFQDSKSLRKSIMRIVTDSLEPGESKDPDTSSIFTIYQAFASEEQTHAFREAFEQGIGWGDAKSKLFELIEEDLAEPRARYQHYCEHPELVEELLQEGEVKARVVARECMQRVRDFCGIQTLRGGS